uniref:F-box domain-containing protein n=1 Tax=Aplanochytrium stocchinoi TaxID=215587 RepID=A0A7S3V0X5_9STRA|mmetsp:Transcript_17257/g.21255  ORF Transcript_17257/g.21255 Transcript_17257/m.21255 type:complete len:239 (-) Transcript_17257:232-948(-)|eukprot:CAMPEP_0204850556 /NCGR_PEP_ID=MMETSP1347-20130617/8368_1 /ASSEMBLY_ACC=CAM_ASM_000690 /TAXON_ID=215587 /ORGANISM="Aplanochytrium stocchinoi, Strain GSBS06" /LENGTH=238 /DNA_ID=CAMNT_0051993603 /DNA_START=35 /DNA_END=751 /DNA_ORIENTATION=-
MDSEKLAIQQKRSECKSLELRLLRQVNDAILSNNFSAVNDVSFLGHEYSASGFYGPTMYNDDSGATFNMRIVRVGTGILTFYVQESKPKDRGDAIRVATISSNSTHANIKKTVNENLMWNIRGGSEKVSFARLPHEAYVKILEYLDVKSICKTFIIHRFGNSFSSNDEIWTFLALRDFKIKSKNTAAENQNNGAKMKIVYLQEYKARQLQEIQQRQARSTRLEFLDMLEFGRLYNQFN